MTVACVRPMTYTQRRTIQALLVALMLAAVLLGASHALAITRDSVLARAQVRIDKPVPYSQSAYYAGYRTDCSGYVSMCWKTGSSYNTRSFYRVTHPIKVSSLKPGDALLKPGYHIRLFYGWLDDSHTDYVAYESASGVGIAGTTIRSIKQDLAWGYKPVRYDRIAASPASRNLLRNPTFNVWARSWNGAKSPLWWDVSGSWFDPPTIQRKDTYVTARNSLELRNLSDSLEEFAEISQGATIIPGARYRLKAYTRSVAPTATVQLTLQYLDANGTTVAETSTEHFAVTSSAFTKRYITLTSPQNAVRARVSVRVAGGVNETPEGIASGSAAIIDNMSLYRPYLSVGITRSRSYTYRGRTVVLSGLVSPASSVGATATTYVKKPGSSTWRKLATTKVYPSDGAAKWRKSYTFSSRAARGTYYFKTYISGIPDYLGATSGTISVRLK